MTGLGVFITGTDTGVGKTVVACELVRRLRGRGIETGVIKPIETGVGREGPADADALRRASGRRDPIADVCPQQFRLPAAPLVAAAGEGRQVDVSAIANSYDRVRQGCDFVVAEGAGGLLVPIAEDFDMLDLAQHLGLPALLVARAALGTINHTLLSLEVARKRGLEIVGVVISHADGALSEADEANLDALRMRLGDRLLGEIPPRADASPTPNEADSGLSAQASLIDIDRLLSRLRSLSAPA
jgi:dethiobiotin synthetase